MIDCIVLRMFTYVPGIGMSYTITLVSKLIHIKRIILLVNINTLFQNSSVRVCVGDVQSYYADILVETFTSDVV